jgi:predicted NBD/HSP70 family sugar kinase
MKVTAPLDPGFQPAILFNQEYSANVKGFGKSERLVIGLEREGGLLSRWETVIGNELDAATLSYVEQAVSFLLWARGGWRIYVGGPRAIGEHIQKCYGKSGKQSFDRNLMGRVYERDFEVVLTEANTLPAANETGSSLGGYLDGCRIGFDLGASDYKIAAVKDGEVVYSDEFHWNPKLQSDPQYHYEHLNRGLKKAATYLPRVDAIGGSSAGVIVDNKIMVSSLFRSVSPERIGETRAMFLRLRDEWKIPVEVANDGDVTALAGSMSLKVNGLLGIAMGSSEAAGYLNPLGCVTGWLNELAFAPVDYNPRAAIDEWSSHRGAGVSYFSQQGVGRLLSEAQINLPAEMALPEQLKEVQRLVIKNDPRAAKIYETIGVYLGYTIPLYASFYDFDHLLILGRVTTGIGGEILLAKAREVLFAEFPAMAERIQLHLPDEKSRRVGQAVAAASLPRLNR